MSEQSAPSTSARGATVKKKQKVMLAFAVAVVLAVVIAASYLTSNQSAPTPQPIAKPAESANLVTGASAYSDRDAWRVQFGSDMASLQATVKESQARQEKLEKQLAEARAARPPAGPVPAPPPLTQEGPAGSGSSGASVTLPPPPPRPATMAPPTQPQRAGPPPATGMPVFSAAGTFDPPAAPVRSDPSKPSITTITFDEPAPTATAAAGGAKASSTDSGGVHEKQQAGSYIPAGTFVRVLVLNGLDAPTGGQAQNNPSPVLLRVMDHATMPNGFRVDLKGCTLTGNGFGDIASERANVRLDRLSCISSDGAALDVAVRGYVAGEDGKAGMRGKIVAKTGQMLANALFASVGAGIGEAARTASVTTTTGALGNVTTTPNAGQGFQAGLGAGTQRAFDMLAKYYITLAERTFPVVEVNGGRMADVVFSRGFTLEGR